MRFIKNLYSANSEGNSCNRPNGERPFLVQLSETNFVSFGLVGKLAIQPHLNSTEKQTGSTFLYSTKLTDPIIKVIVSALFISNYIGTTIVDKRQISGNIWFQKTFWTSKILIFFALRSLSLCLII